MIFALIQERAGLLTFGKIVCEGDAIFLRNNLVRNFAVESADALIEAFEQPDFGIVAFQDSIRREKLDEDFDEHIFVTISGLAQSLDDEVISIAIHYQRRYLIGFTVHHAVGFGIVDDDPSIRSCLSQPLRKKRPVHGNIGAREQAHSDL
jgi:hypothetical protein